MEEFGNLLELLTSSDGDLISEFWYELMMMKIDNINEKLHFSLSNGYNFRTLRENTAATATFKEERGGAVLVFVA